MSGHDPVEHRVEVGWYRQVLLQLFAGRLLGLRVGGHGALPSDGVWQPGRNPKSGKAWGAGWKLRGLVILGPGRWLGRAGVLRVRGGVRRRCGARRGRGGGGRASDTLAVISGDVGRLTAAFPAGAADSCASAVGEAGPGAGEARAEGRRLAAVWLSAGSAVAAMVGAGWYAAARNGGAPGGDMVGHAAAAEWLRTLPWWDWRGWSDWFYGGQAIGVNYPPLGHAWMRFTDPVHGQMAAVAVGLLVLVPWGALRLSPAVGCTPGAHGRTREDPRLQCRLAGLAHGDPECEVCATVLGAPPASKVRFQGLVRRREGMRRAAAGSVRGYRG